MKRQSVIWVAIEARRYEDMFRECVEEAAGLYREKQNYTQLEHLGVYASNIEPFSDWEALTMEAMVALGRYEEATDLYAETAERYFEERGLKPSKRLLDSLNQLGNQVMHSYDVLDNIQHNLEEKESRKGHICAVIRHSAESIIIWRGCWNGADSRSILCCVPLWTAKEDR